MTDTPADALQVEVAEKTRGFAHDLIVQFYAAIRVARFHSIDNAAAQKALDKLIAALDALFDVQYDVSLLFYSKDFYVNDQRIKASRENYKVFDELADKLKARQIGGLRLPTKPGRDALSHFISVFNDIQPANTKTPYQDINAMLAARGVRSIELTRYAGDTVSELPIIDKRTFTKQSYFRAITVVEQLYQQARDRKPLSLKSAKRVVQNFVDLLEDRTDEHGHLLLLLTQLKNWRGYLFNHAVNTAVLSLVLGSSIGLSRELLRDLGICALLADIGNATLPRSVLDSPDELTEAQWDVVRMHPITGVPAIASFQELDRVLMRAIIACLTHHKSYGGAGYPASVGSEGGLFGQVIAVCDRYDAMTTSRPYRSEPLSPPEAMEALVLAGGKELNPVIVRAFVQCMGALPSGTVVLLGTGEIGLIINQKRKVRILSQGTGSLVANSEVEIGAEPGQHNVHEIIAKSDAGLSRLKTTAIFSDN